MKGYGAGQQGLEVGEMDDFVHGPFKPLEAGPSKPLEAAAAAAAAASLASYPPQDKPDPYSSLPPPETPSPATQSLTSQGAGTGRCGNGAPVARTACLLPPLVLLRGSAGPVAMPCAR